MKLNSNDLKLIECAGEVIVNNLDLNKDRNTIVGSAVSTKSGNI